MNQGAVDAELAEVRHALADYVTGLRHLVKVVDDSGLAQLGGPSELVEFMQAFEQSRNLLPLIDHALIAEAERLDLPTTLCQGNLRRVLTSALSLSKPEAARRVKAAAAVGARVSMLGEALAPVRPLLAAAQRSGEVSAEKVAIISTALDKVDRRGFDPAGIDAGEQLLAEQAPLLPPEDLKTVADRVVDAIDPDGTLPDEQLNADRWFFHLQPTKDGAWTGEFRLTGPVGAKLKTLIDPLTKVRVDGSGDIDIRTLGNAATMRWRTSAIANSEPATPPMPAASRPPSSSPSTLTTSSPGAAMAPPATAPSSRSTHCWRWRTTPKSSPRS